MEVHRSLVTICREANSFEHGHGSVDLVDGDDKINVTGHHRLGGPMVHRDAPDGAPSQFGTFERIDHPHHVVGAACCLPVVELSPCHAGEFSRNRNPWAPGLIFAAPEDWLPATNLSASSISPGFGAWHQFPQVFNLRAFAVPLVAQVFK